MVLFDINIYVYAHREDSSYHVPIKKYVEKILKDNSPFGYSLLALSGFLRIITHPRIFNPPTDLKTAVQFTEEIITLPNALKINPGPMHWTIFKDLCRTVNAKGNLIPDAYFAALAIESGCAWVTTDRDYSRFQDLKWINPLS